MVLKHIAPQKLVRDFVMSFGIPQVRSTVDIDAPEHCIICTYASSADTFKRNECILLGMRCETRDQPVRGSREASFPRTFGACKNFCVLCSTTAVA
jgi:hypothetical protein